MAVQLPSAGETPWDVELNAGIRSLDTRLTAVEQSGGGGSAAAAPKRLQRISTYYSWWSYVNGLSPATAEEAAAWYGNYDHLIAPDGTCDPRHEDHVAFKAIIAVMNAKYPDTKVWGYITITRDQTGMTYTDKTAQQKMDQWKACGIHGIFMDEYGYDYGTPVANDRTRQNELLDYCHSIGMYAVMNAWEPDQAMGGTPAPHCGPGDIFYAESFTYHSTDFTANAGWAPLQTYTASPWYQGMVPRATTMQTYRKNLGVNFWVSNMLQRTKAAALPYADQMLIMRQCEAAARIFRADGLAVDSYQYSNGPDDAVLDPIPFVLDNGDEIVPLGTWKYTTNLSVEAFDLGLKMYQSAAPQVVRHDVVEMDRQAQVLRRDGGTMTGTLIATPSTATGVGASLRIPHGIAPTVPKDGDIWTTTTGLFVRINGVIKQVAFLP